MGNEIFPSEDYYYALSKKELSGTLKTLKKNKSRDPAGLINEIFKPPWLECF